MRKCAFPAAFDDSSHVICILYIIFYYFYYYMIRNVHFYTYINIILLYVNGRTNHRMYLITHASAAVPYPR